MDIESCRDIPSVCRLNVTISNGATERFHVENTVYYFALRYQSSFSWKEVYSFGSRFLCCPLPVGGRTSFDPGQILNPRRQIPLLIVAVTWLASYKVENV
jgi:hypothetical protein